jgi:hypothetical protein
MAKFLSLFFSALFFTNLVEAAQYDFDSVVMEDKIVEEDVYLGYGCLQFLDLLANQKVQKLYNVIRTLGTLHISVKKIRSVNPNEKPTTRFTVTAHRNTEDAVAKLVIDMMAKVGGTTHQLRINFSTSSNMTQQ